VAKAQDSQVKRRLTPKEIEALPTQSAGAGTSGLSAVTTRVLFGDPTKAGLYTIELKVAPDTGGFEPLSNSRAALRLAALADLERRTKIAST
jgi:hypothetical protein